MALQHEIIPYVSGWAALTVPDADAFASKEVARDVAIEYARKLQSCQTTALRLDLVV